MQEKINFILKKTGWTQAELAIRLDISQAQISQVLSGASDTSAKTAEKLNLLYTRVRSQNFRLVASSEKGSCWIRHDPFTHGAQNLTQEEYQAFKKAVRSADPLNGQEMGKARGILEKAGFTIEFE